MELSGNRVSEISAFERTGLGNLVANQPVNRAVAPGFLLKNQKLGRAPPNVEVFTFLEGPAALCSVGFLKSYLELSTHKRGPLFCNSKSESPLPKSSLSGILPEKPRHQALCYFGRLGQRTAPAEITRRAFWRSSSTPIFWYLSSKGNISEIALKKC